MRTAVAGGLVTALFAAGPPVRAPIPLPLLPSVALVRLEVARSRVVVVEDVDVPRGGWMAGDLDFYAAFGAPGAPTALEARLLSVRDGALEPDAGDRGEALPVERASHRPATARELIGPAQMAGVTVHVSEAAFRRATARGGMAVLRLRSLLASPEPDARTGREVVVRLGAWQGTPMTLASVVVAPLEPTVRVTGASASLCGPDADPWPLAVAVVPPVREGPPTGAPPPIAPVLSVRHTRDDLCIRYWAE